MKYHDTIRYPFPVDALFPFFTDPDFFVRKYLALGATNVKVIHAEPKGSQSSITVTRDVPVEVPIPSFARSLVPSHITLIQTDAWDTATRRGSLQIEFKGMPVHMKCDITLADQAGGAVEELDFDIRVNIPLVGGKLEALLAQDLRLKFQRDADVTLDIMKGHAGLAGAEGA